MVQIDQVGLRQKTRPQLLQSAGIPWQSGKLHSKRWELMVWWLPPRGERSWQRCIRCERWMGEMEDIRWIIWRCRITSWFFWCCCGSVFLNKAEVFLDLYWVWYLVHQSNQKPHCIGEKVASKKHYTPSYKLLLLVPFPTPEALVSALVDASAPSYHGPLSSSPPTALSTPLELSFGLWLTSVQWRWRLWSQSAPSFQ